MDSAEWSFSTLALVNVVKVIEQTSLNNGRERYVAPGRSVGQLNGKQQCEWMIESISVMESEHWDCTSYMGVHLGWVSVEVVE